MTPSELDETFDLMNIKFDDLNPILKYGIFIRPPGALCITNLKITPTLDPKYSSNLAKFLLSKKGSFGIKKMYNCELDPMNMG
jgi:hypothetical protein